MNTKQKIYAIIIVIILVLSGILLYKTGYFPFLNQEKKEIGTEENVTTPPPPTPPESTLLPFMRTVSPEDEGVHFNKIRVSREWWYWSAILDGKDSDL